MAKKAKGDVVEDLILDEDDDFDIEIDDTPPSGRTPGTQVLCLTNFAPTGKRDMFLGEIVRSVNFSKEFAHRGSSGKGFQVRFIEGSRPTPAHCWVETKKGGPKLVETDDNIFLSARDVQTLNASNRRKWSRYKKSRYPGKSRKKKKPRK